MKSAETLENLIAEAVKKGIKSAISEGKGKPSNKKPKKITRSQLAEGVRKALRMALKEHGMPGGAMPAPGMGAGAPMSAPTQEDVSGSSSKPISGHTIPSPEELQSALSENPGWDMDLQGADGLAFDYAMEVTQVGYPNIQTGEGLHKVLMALMQAPSPEEIASSMSPEELDDPHSQLNRIINSWEARYGRSGHKIDEHARNLVSNILESLGWEWV